MKSPNPRISDIFVAMLLAGTITCLVVFFSRTTAYKDAEFWGYDFLINHGSRAQSPPNVVIIDFDEATFDELRQYPIPRRTIAEIILRVAASSPRIIGLDMFLTEARSAEEDATMNAALARAGNVILASQAPAGGIPELLPLSEFCKPEEPGQSSGFCAETSPGALAYAAVNLPLESDGFIRAFFVFTGGSNPAITFPVMIAQQFAGEGLKPVNRDGVRFLGKKIPYSVPEAHEVLIGTWYSRTAAHISAQTLLQEPPQPLTELRDKIVLIGQSSNAARDLMLTPLFRRETTTGPRIRLSGTDIHAAAIETLLRGEAVRVFSNRNLFLLLYLVSVLAVLLQLRLPLRISVGLIGGLTFLLYVMAQGMFVWEHMWFQYTTLALGLSLSLPVSMTYRFVQERFHRTAVTHEREQLMGLFSRYVSPEVAQQIWERREEVVLAGEQRIATVLFSDIRNFTSLTEGKDSHKVLGWLNEYLTEMDEVIQVHGGFLNKFMGDGLMVLFGVPLSDGIQADACSALRTARHMLDRVNDLNLRHNNDPGFPALKIGIGIHTGTLTCGNIGSRNRVEYSVIGETVNLASRLEGLTKEFGTGIIFSASTFDAVKEEFRDLRELGNVLVRGFEGTIRLYTVSNESPREGTSESLLGGKE
jgi:adenylate cyclase